MFSQDKMKKKDIINLLACEYAPMGEIIGKEFEDMTKNNIAQYDGATVHISERCLLEISRVFEENIFSRIETQAIEIFFFELIMLQEAAISRICEKITKELEEENVKPYRKNNIEILDNLACEMSQSVLFLDFDCFIFPTVKISAKKIAKCFGIDDLTEKYLKYKNILEKLMNIHRYRTEEIENNTTNNILMLLTITQVLPVLLQFFNVIFYGKITINNIITTISSITSCGIIFLIFNILKKRNLKRTFKE